MDPNQSPYGPVKRGGMAAPARAKGLLMSDLQKMNEGQLGMSQAEKQQAIGAATQAAGAQTAALQSQMAGQALATGGPANQFAGQAQQANMALNKQAAETAAQAAGDVNKTNAAITEAQRQDINARLGAQQERARENAMFGVNSALQLQQILAQGAASAGKTAVSGGTL